MRGRRHTPASRSGRRARRLRPAEAPALRSAAPLSWIALARFKNTAAVTRFVQLLGDRDSTKRLRAAAALGEVRDPDIVPLLIPLLKDRDTAMRRTAAEPWPKCPMPPLSAPWMRPWTRLLVSAIVEQAPALAAKAGTEATAALLAKMLTRRPEKAPVAASPFGARRGRARPRPAANPCRPDEPVAAARP